VHHISFAIADLQAKWHTLPDIERAQAILPIIRAGVSRRHLAHDLGISEGSIRILLQLLEADPIDLQLFRSGRISKNEVIRRVRGISVRREPEPFVIARHGSPCPVPQAVVVHHPRISVAAAGSEAILSWLRQDCVRHAYASEILEEAHAALIAAEEKGILPGNCAPSSMSAEEIIRRCRPNPADFDMDVAWLGDWLAIWAFYLIPSASIRREAFNMAKQVAEKADRRSFDGSTLAA
jgi:hypothetical protein